MATGCVIKLISNNPHPKELQNAQNSGQAKKLCKEDYPARGTWDSRQCHAAIAVPLHLRTIDNPKQHAG
jgi:hypothetical protein